MKTILTLVLLLGAVLGARAENTTVAGNSALTNSLKVASQPTKLYAVTGMNLSGSAEYIQVFQKVTPVNGDVPVFSFPVFASSPFALDFSFYGADLDAITICASTTATTLTLATANTTLQAIVKSR